MESEITVLRAMVPHIAQLRRLYWYTVKTPRGAQDEFSALWTLLDMLPTAVKEEGP